ncbi:MAG: isoprenylcysteine carboxylmethyltransferase family protein [Anaerolineae bacterium]|jgi:protein-S-isoprenylcysteine O-methyltransferase Ste14
MSPERRYQIALCVLYTCFTLLRLRYRRAAQAQVPVLRADGGDAQRLGVLIPYEVMAFFLYLLLPGTLAWAAVPLPAAVRWAGAALGCAALVLFAWVHHALGANYFWLLQLREGHTLVTSGPYRWVRHPMYTAFIMLHIAVALLSANAFLGLTWLGGLALLLVGRVRREEVMLNEAFGEEYREYTARTGRFLPQMGRAANLAKARTHGSKKPSQG